MPLQSRLANLRLLFEIPAEQPLPDSSANHLNSELGAANVKPKNASREPINRLCDRTT
jgi:hypothetical protein